MFGAPITVKAGATVTVKNADGETHTLAADDGSFDTGNIAAGASATFVAPMAGTFPFHCNVHANMHGTLTVS
jgi:plastocyanin